MDLGGFFGGIADSIRGAGDSDWFTTNGWMVPLSMITAGAGSAIFGGGAAAGEGGALGGGGGILDSIGGVGGSFGGDAFSLGGGSGGALGSLGGGGTFSGDAFSLGGSGYGDGWSSAGFNGGDLSPSGSSGSNGYSLKDLNNPLTRNLLSNLLKSGGQSNGTGSYSPISNAYPTIPRQPAFLQQPMQQPIQDKKDMELTALIQALRGQNG